MEGCQFPYVQLFRDVLESGGDVYQECLAPWLRDNPGEQAWIQDVGTRCGDPIPLVTNEELARLYAASRINEILLLAFEPPSELDGDDGFPRITLADYMRFMRDLGFRQVEASFSPLFHEIVTVEQSAEVDDPIRLIDELWPPLMLGDMIFSRGGVRVAGGRNCIRKEIAEKSTLYWAYRRRHRPHEDLSHGWGSNSQWRTAFRRDYFLGNTLYFNVFNEEQMRLLRTIRDHDAQHGETDDSLIPSDRLELLMHRCFITVDKPHAGLFPYHDSVRVVDGVATLE